MNSWIDAKQPSVPAAPDRYHRHSLIDWFSQTDVSYSRIAVIGAGAIGNEVVKNLTLLGVGQIDVYDFDTVEIHNLTRSVLLRETDIGRSKAEAVVARAAELDPNCRLRAVPGDIRDHLNPSTISQYRAVISAVDNFDARLRLNQLCLLAGVDLVNSAIDSRFVSLEVFAHSQWDVACYECHLPETAYQRIAERYSCGGLLKRAFEERKVPTTAITASLAGAMAAAAALGLGQRPGQEQGQGQGQGQERRAEPAPASRSERPSGSRRVFLDSHTMVSQAANLTRQPGCAACAGLGSRPQRVRAEALLSTSTHDDNVLVDNVLVILPEPIITACRCTQCGSENSARGPANALIGQRARHFDDQLSWCPRCQSASMNIELRERFGLKELTALTGQMPQALAPAAFALARRGNDTMYIEWNTHVPPADARKSP